MAALACASESKLWQLNVLLRTGLGVVFFFEVVTWLEVARFEPALLHLQRPFFVFDIALVGAALCLTYLNWFERNWRAMTMAFCLILMASRWCWRFSCWYWARLCWCRGAHDGRGYSRWRA